MADRISMVGQDVVTAEVQKASNGWILTFKKGATPALVSVHEVSDTEKDAMDLGKEIIEGLDGKLEA